MDNIDFYLNAAHGKNGWNKCCYCGKFIAYENFEKNIATINYELDTFGNEDEVIFHNKCENI